MNNMHCHIRYCVALIITSLLSCITQNEPMMSLSTVTLLMLHQDINSAHEWRRPRGSVWANVWLILKAVKEQSRSQPTPKCHSPYIIPACIFHRGTPAYTRLPVLPTRQKRSRHSRVESGSASWPSIMQSVSKESGNLDSERMSFLDPHCVTWMLIYWLCHSYSCVFNAEFGFANELATGPQRVAQFTVIQSDSFVNLVILFCVSHQW